MQNSEKNPILAAVLSFIITGLGQLYNGDVVKGFILFVAHAVAFILWPLLGRLGSLVSIFIWLYSVIEAYTAAQALNDGGYRITQRNW